ncbi:MAG: fatty acid desaturase [Aquabacterium sp.]
MDLMSLWDALVAFGADGLTTAPWWVVLLFTLAATHATIAAVTVFLHRAQAHRALELGPIPSHFFRFWLWMTTGMVTKEWVAVHRKHHAKCETAEDPHSPVTRGIRKVLLEGSELYRIEAKNQETLDRYGHNTPDDWMERHVYSRHHVLGVASMMVVNVLLFGVIGVTVWAIQMIWIPITAAGMINGLGHWWGYRNFESQDAATNISPWGIVIGGEELHNNHHTYPTSAKLSVKPYEFDIGWMYIRIFETLGWARVRKTVPQLTLGDVRAVVDHNALEALIAHRYEVMARYAKELERAVRTELSHLKQQGAAQSARLAELRVASRWLHRDAEKIPADVKPELARAVGASPLLTKLVDMREELRALWTRTNVSAEQAVTDLQVWCRKAEDSGIAALADFSVRLRAARA